MIFYDKKKNANHNPKDLKFLKDLATDARSDYSDNTFCVFKSINGLFYLIYPKFFNSIVSYDIIDNKKLIIIKRAHKGRIVNLNHSIDKINNRDLFISMSDDDLKFCIKLWNVNNFECILELNNIQGYKISSCFLNDNNSLYIITNYCPIEAIDLEGNIVKKFKNDDEGIYSMDTFNDDKNSNIYIITGHKDLVKSYDYYKNKVYNKYQDNSGEKKSERYSIIINNNDSIIKLIESSYDGYIRIWNFYKGSLLNKIKAGFGSMGICLWNNNYIFVGCCDKIIRLIEMKKGYIIQRLTGHDGDVNCIKKINHPKYGECLLSIGISVFPRLSKIKLWVINYK